ncbi:MAG: hypothetical protein FJX29_10185 [Alphaproteobacteria bacterium]|nr:hypothetical protein [Alphaproteobacteria bacterium]
MKTYRKALVPALAALVAATGLMVSVQSAEARWRGGGYAHPGFVHKNHGWRGGPVAAGVLGGLALGAVSVHAARSRYYDPGYGYQPDYAPAYAPACVKQHQPVYDNWGNFHGYRKVRVCQ